MERTKTEMTMQNNPLTFQITSGTVGASTTRGLPGLRASEVIGVKGGFVFRAYWPELLGYREVRGAPSGVDTARASFYARKPKPSKY